MRAQLEKILDRMLGAKSELVYPPPNIGADYASNVAFRIAREKGREPLGPSTLSSGPKGSEPLGPGLLGVEGPAAVAAELQKKLLASPRVAKVFERVELVGGFLNFTLSPDFLKKQFSYSLIRTNKRIRKDKRRRTVLVEYSSPNIGKPLSIAHIRSTVIGDALARIYRASGYKVITDNHLGDWGLQTGVLIAAWKLWSKKPAAKMTMEELLELYVRYHTMMKEHEELASKARMETALLQQEDPETLKVWKVLWKKSAADYNRLYRRLGIRFDYTLGESFYRKSFPKVVASALKKGVAEKSQGAIVIHVGDGKPPLIIQKQDGGYLYGTFDLATIEYRRKRFRPKLVLYVISNEQTLYFEQLFAAAQKLGWMEAGELEHVKFGLVRGEDLKRLSTREGKMISLEEVIDEAVRRAKAIVSEKNPKLPEREKKKIAEMVGIGALKYNDLSQNRNTDIVFDWDKMLDLRGNSAPYVQYTYARLRSIMRKSKPPPLKGASLVHLVGGEEIALMKKTLQLQEAVEDAAKEYAPNIVANYLWDLANLANTFYEKYPVLKADKDIREARLALIDGVSRTLREGLALLGIEAPERV